ncbi:MAG: metal-dependent phosphohydrolase [uncultured bacterium (gcode 4)]|uniref:Metal-dependent phosphohydrolase n=1 Tax=uncultured bacterium (gcode 4) TaxID=1234023 RepID=K2G6H5_9BACT|nr:MAG: metal-dependent phosphohydrolase [uncultured bacterium (gcode 4)]
MNEQKIINNVLRYVLDMLEKVNHYPYHNINHTLDVYSRSEYLCDKEFIYLEEKTDVLIAALFHDTWFTVRYADNEVIWAEIARKYLQSIDWKEERIQRIEKIIMATVVFSDTTTKLEKIIQDADMDNLWRKDCLIKTMGLKKELKIINKYDISTKDWLKSTYSLLRKHQFHTYTAIAERNKTKKENMKKLEERIFILEKEEQ